MTPFETILATARTRAGGDAALAKRLPEPKSATALQAVPDDRYLSQMCLRVFRAGLKHSLVDGKWPAFEQVFLGFDPARVRAISDEGLERLMADRRIIRHWGKIKSVRANAAALIELAGTAAAAPISPNGRATTRSACGWTSPSGSARWAAIPAPISCAWWLRIVLS